MANGNTRLMGRALEMDHKMVQRRIERSPKLFALYGNRVEGAPEIEAPTELETVVRTPETLPPEIVNSERAEEMMKQDRELLRSGLQAAGIKSETIDKMRALDGLARNAGSFLSVSLDYTHRLHIYSTAALFEEMVYIRETYLRPGQDGKPKYDPMVMVFWQRAFNEIADLLGKSYDRTLAGTQAMVAMMKARGKTPGAPAGAKSKPGW